jgi:TolA-binding protein
MSYKNMLLVLVICVLTSTNIAVAEDRPLGTIGDPQVKKVQPVVAPAKANDDDSMPVNLRSQEPAQAQKKVSSPFNLAPDDNEVFKITPTAIIPQNKQPLRPGQPQAANNNAPQAPEKSLLLDPNNEFGLTKQYNDLEKSIALIKKKDYAGAKVIVQQSVDWLTVLTEYHIQLFKKLNGIETAKNQSVIEKKIALDLALLRDKAYYQLGLICLAEKKDRDAVKYLVEVIKSQPQTELGMKAYEILQQIGFTEKVRLMP